MKMCSAPVSFLIYSATLAAKEKNSSKDVLLSSQLTLGSLDVVHRDI